MHCRHFDKSVQAANGNINRFVDVVDFGADGGAELEVSLEY